MMTTRLVAAGFAAMLGLLIVSAEGSAETPHQDSTCIRLQREDFLSVVDAPTRVVSAAVAAAGDGVPEHCVVDGEVIPEVGIQVRLPTGSWNGKFLQVGCGGWCGSKQALAECADPLRRGYACVSTDTGHRGAGHEAAWAYNNLRAEMDFAFRANHVTSIAGKAIAARYYRRLPTRSYFVGCSTGGQHALGLAQRYPSDFDGIVAGHPTVNMAEFALSMLWSYRALFGTGGQPLLSQVELELVHSAAVKRCDLDDNLADGIIGQPQSCQFDPAELLCTDRRGARQCLSPTQVDAVRKMYQGPTGSDGKERLAAGFPRGSELDWLSVYVARYGSVITEMMEGYFKYMAFVPDPAPAWSSALFDFDRDPPRLATMSALYSVDNPDLRRFEARGAKLIGYHGWSDGLQNPQIVDYYETVQRLSGGRPVTQEFFRLFMLPGVHHCGGGGEGAYAVDFLSHLEAWVERGEAPDKLIASHPAAASDAGQGDSPGAAAFTRPVFPYPARSWYSGFGDPRSADSFVSSN